MKINIFLLPAAVISIFFMGFRIQVTEIPAPQNLVIEVFTVGGTGCEGASIFVYEIGNYSNNAVFQNIPGTCKFQGTLDIPSDEVTTFVVDVCLGGPQYNERGHTTIEVSKVLDKIPTYAVNTAYGECLPY